MKKTYLGPMVVQITPPSIAMVIGVGELMYQAQQVESASFRWHEAFTFATVGYLGISLLITLLSSWYQHVYPVRTS